MAWSIDKLCRIARKDLLRDEGVEQRHQCGEALWAVLRKRPTGIFHLAGRDSVNRWQFGRKVAAAFGLDASLVKRVDSSRFPGIAARPKNTTFSVKRMERELGVRALTLAEGLAAMKAHMEEGA